jgi:hypothetical protein
MLRLTLHQEASTLSCELRARVEAEVDVERMAIGLNRHATDVDIYVV